MLCLNGATAAILGRCFLALILALVLESNLPAEPVVYTGIVVTDVRVGSTLMHNASLKLTFAGDSNDILAVPVPSTECTGTPFYYLGKGTARMEIEFHGRTQTARLQDGQVFVALDNCNGGIGFGSFLGPNGLEPAYPLGFTLGTAEAAAINESAPLATILSTTGSAWSCIGYPPLGNLDGQGATADLNCTPPDAYPLKSDIGDIFLYQPYFEYEGAPAIASNHAGSTNRGAFLVRQKPDSTLATPATATPADSESELESGVVYTLRTVADGSLGGHVFHQALVTLRMMSDRESITSQPSPVDPTRPLYENRAGYATITVDDGRRVIHAEFEPGEVYVRYDTGAGVAGFGSPISPTYPIALNCSDSAYPSDSNYTADCLQGEAWDYLNSGVDFILLYVFRGGTLAQLSSPVEPSAGVTALPQSLSRDTLLTGTAHTCAGAYTVVARTLNVYFPGDLGVCGGPAPRGLHTSEGELFLQDLEGGSLLLNNPPPNESGSGGGWDLANSGFLHVEVHKGDN